MKDLIVWSSFKEQLVGRFNVYSIQVLFSGNSCVDTQQALTHDEIWDDSALVDAYNNAIQEYMVNSIPSIIRIRNMFIWFIFKVQHGTLPKDEANIKPSALNSASSSKKKKRKRGGAKAKSQNQTPSTTPIKSQDTKNEDLEPGEVEEELTTPEKVITKHFNHNHLLIEFNPKKLISVTSLLKKRNQNSKHQNRFRRKMVCQFHPNQHQQLQQKLQHNNMTILNINNKDIMKIIILIMYIILNSFIMEISKNFL